MEAQESHIIYLAPEAVLADDNSRFNLKQSRLDSLSASVEEMGEILQPVEVEELPAPVVTAPIKGKKGGAATAAQTFTHRLTSGFYRHKVAELLNAKGAGLKLPAIVRVVPDALTRLKHQLTENMERENQSPMDKAVAIKKLLDAGMSRVEVRNLFAAAGGRKGSTVQPLSNSMLNIMLNFLELPKDIQAKIHDGRVGVAAAYELGRVAPDKRSAVLARAEADRAAEEDKQAKEEDRYLAAEKKLVDAKEEAKTILAQAEEKKAGVVAAEELIKTKTGALRDIQRSPLGDGRGYLELNPDEKSTVSEKLKAAEADVKGAQKEATKVKNELAKLLTKAKTAEQTAEEKKAALETARKNAKKSAKKPLPVGPDDIKQASKAEGTDTGHIALSAAEMRSFINQVAERAEHPKVKAFGQVIKRCFDGVITTKDCYHQMAVLTGEMTGKVRAVPKAIR